jgi:hypothetical protein
MSKASRGGDAQARYLIWPSRPERGAARRPWGWRVRRGVRLARPKARARPCARVRCRGAHACSRPHARARGASTRYSEARHDAIGAARGGTPCYHLQAHTDGAKPGSHVEVTSRDDGKLRGMDCPGAPTRRSGHTRGSVGQQPRPERVSVCAGHNRACACAASPCPLSAAVWKPKAQHETARRRTKRPLQNSSRLDDRHPHESHRMVTTSLGA